MGVGVWVSVMCLVRTVFVSWGVRLALPGWGLGLGTWGVLVWLVSVGGAVGGRV